MKDSAFVVLDKNRIVKMTKTKPDLSSGQRGVEIVVTMPDIYFNAPFPKVDVTFESDDVIEPTAAVEVRTFRERVAEDLERLRVRALDTPAWEPMLDVIRGSLPESITQYLAEGSYDDLSTEDLARLHDVTAVAFDAHRAQTQEDQ